MNQPRDTRRHSFHSSAPMQSKPKETPTPSYVYWVTIERPELNMHIKVGADTIDELLVKIKAAEDKASEVSAKNPSAQHVKYAKRGGKASALASKKVGGGSRESV